LDGRDVEGSRRGRGQVDDGLGRVTSDDDPRASLDRELRRVTDRLRALGPARLDRPGDDGRSPAALGHEAAQALADLAAEAVGRGRRAVPVLPVHAVADQVTVTGHDLIAEGDDDAVRAGVARLVALRRSL
jgi:hypothetical protein